MRTTEQNVVVMATCESGILEREISLNGAAIAAPFLC
ncbi:MAG: hypothetical protein ACFWTY_14975 [Shouchella clausii]